MKKILLLCLFCFSIIKNNSNIVNDNPVLTYNYLTNNVINYDGFNDDYIYVNEFEVSNNTVKMVNTTYNNKREYNFIVYKNSNNYNIASRDDIKNAIYNGLNDGNNNITMYCIYDNYNECISDFRSIYRNKRLLYSINNYVSPYNRYLSLNYKININNGKAKIEITVTKKYSDNQIEEINKKIDKYISKLKINKMSDEEKIKWAHDFIIDRNKYDKEAIKKGSGDAYSAYGALVGNKAICQGYAEAIAIVLDRFDIPNILISNDLHIWNLVYVNNKWYHLDATWDDPILYNGKQTKIYDYYLITSKRLSGIDSSSNHKFDSKYYKETK